MAAVRPMDLPLLGGGAETTTGAFGVLALALQAGIVACFYKAEITVGKENAAPVYDYYVGVALMMFVGFGYLMTFLKSYGLGAVGFTMFITCLGVEFAIICESFMSKGNLNIDFMSLLNGNFAVAAVLISFGGLIGKISPTQIIILTVVELACYCANKVYFLTNMMNIQDCGGTIIIHVFGAYFGLCACKVLGAPKNADLNASSYVSDIFSLVGTVFLWLFWPSFVAGALPAGPAQTQALINTVLALLASSVVTFGLTPLMSGGKIGTVPIQNATLAGGVAIGATANFIGPFGAIVVGSVGGALSTYGFIKCPFFGDVDTCGISNLHGMPGICGGLVSVVLPLFYEGTPIVMANQAIGLAGTLAVACVTGAVTGGIMKIAGSPEDCYTDATFWDCADDIAK